LDEAQNFPEIFPRLRNAIDADRKRFGRFLILGSVSPGLMKSVSDLLTGRAALTELSPFSVRELPHASSQEISVVIGWRNPQTRPIPKWQKNYLELLAGRISRLGPACIASDHSRLFRMLAATHGGVE
jgi:predicted AAA+ superfamily ATPase